MAKSIRNTSDVESTIKELEAGIRELEDIKQGIRKAIKDTESCLKREKSKLRQAIEDKKLYENEIRLFKSRYYSHRSWSKKHPLIALENIANK